MATKYVSRMYLNGKLYVFEMLAPITGDGIFQAWDEKNKVFSHAIVPNPDARRHQQLALARRGS